MKNMVELYDDEPRVGTFTLANGLDRPHKSVLQTLNDYRDEMESFGVLKTQKLKATGGRAANEIMLNEDQFMFLGTLLKNNAKVVQFKMGIVKEFGKCRKRLFALEKHKATTNYQLTRDHSKLIRREATDVIKMFVEYAESQGSKNSKMYYSNITRMLNGLLFTIEGRYKNIRNLLTVPQLMAVCSAEQVIDRALKDGMSRKQYYKDIYKEARSRVEQFVELHGKSDILNICMELEFKEDAV